MASELKDSPASEETADAESQTKDAWCGSRGGDWWLASVASNGDCGDGGFDGFDGFDGLVASSGVDRSGNDDGAACFVDFGSTKNHQYERLPVAQVVGICEN